MSDRADDRLYRRLPGHVRALDAKNGLALAALIDIVTRELEVVEGDIDQLYDNWFVETAEGWALPYIGDLVGARPLTPFGADGTGLRAYIANTLGYRQSKGVAAALEQLARDVTGWPCIAVEFFQRLIQTQNVNHVRPAALGTVSLHHAEAARATGGPFEIACHTAGAGQPEGASGRYAIPNLGLFLWRLRTHAFGFVSGAETGYLGAPQPRSDALGPGFRRFDPLGRDRALFNRPRADTELGARVGRRQVPGPLDRRLLHLDLEALRAGDPGGGDWVTDPPALQIRLNGAAVPPEARHSCNLETFDDGTGPTWRRPAAQGQVFFDPELGRLSLHPDDADAPVEASFAQGAPYDIGGGPYDRRASVEAWRDLIFIEGETAPFRRGVSARPEDVENDPELGQVVPTLSRAIAAWNAQAMPGRRGVIAILDSATYPQNLAPANRVIDLPAGATLAIVAAGWPGRELPGDRVERFDDALSPRGRRPHIRSAIRIRGSADPAEDGGRLILDGLLIEGEARVEDGNLADIQLRHTTLGANAEGLPRGLRVLAGNAQLSVTADHAVAGALQLGQAAGRVRVRDSILGEDRTADADPETSPVVIDAPEANLEIARATLFGRARGRTLDAENAILQGRIDIARRQSGCLRYSFAPLTSRTPRRFRCQPDRALADATARLGRDPTDAERAAILTRVVPQFTATAHASDRFAQLALTCPPEIAAGAEGGAAMGAGFSLNEPARTANLAASLDEYLPFGLTTGAIFMR